MCEQMKVDLRVPTIVISGAWNPAIFQPGWIARHLFEVPEGTKKLLAEVVTNNGERQIRYLDNVGISVVYERIEFFINSLDDECISTCEKAAINVLKTLYHTPVGPFGLNFQFCDEINDGILWKNTH